MLKIYIYLTKLDMLYIIRYIKQYLIIYYGKCKKLLSLEDEGIAKELESVAEALHKTQKEVVESALDFYFDYTDTVVADKVTQDIQMLKMFIKS